MMSPTAGSIPWGSYPIRHLTSPCGSRWIVVSMMSFEPVQSSVMSTPPFPRLCEEEEEEVEEEEEEGG
jgi:hypothetical protein